MFTMENAQVEVHQTGDGGHHGEQRSIEKSLAVGDRPGSRGEEYTHTTGTVLRRQKRQETETSKKKEASVRRNSSGYYSNTSDQDKTGANEQEKSNGVGGKNLKSIKSKVDTGLGTKKLGPQNRQNVGQKKSEPLLPSQFDRRASRDGLFKVPEPPASNFNRYAQNRRSLTNLFSKNTEKCTKYGGRTSNKSKSKENTPDNTEEKRNNFLNRRSMTSLSLFGSSKKQSEPTNNAVTTKEKKSSLSRLRSARSSLDLSSIGFGSLSRSQSKVALADLKEEENTVIKSDPPTVASTRKFSTDRPWFDLERLWKDRAKDLPAEEMFNNLKRRERVVRSESRDASVVSSNGIDFLDTSPPTSSQLTPATLKKTVNLLSPEMLTNWYEKRNIYGPRRNSISNLFFNGEKKPNSPLADPKNSLQFSASERQAILNKRKSMANLDEILSAEARRQRKGVQRSESAKVSHQRQPLLQPRKQSEPQFDLTQSLRDSQGSPDIVSTQQSTSSSNSSIANSSSIAEPRAWQSPGSQHSTDTSTPPPAKRFAGVHPTGIPDSDLENDPPDWRLSLSQEALQKLKPKEQKRQDVINELFQTEKSHIRNLKVLEHVFRQPLLECGLMSKELVDRLFPNIDDVLEVHNRYCNSMKEAQKDGFPIGNIGNILTDMFLDSNGDTLVKVGAEFTKNQKSTIEELRKIRCRDSKLEQFLSEQERNPSCRRLQLQSHLAMEHQRLVKYPLLLEQLARHTDRSVDNQEYEVVRVAMNKTKEILDSIDKQVAEAQNKQRMVDIQANLDKSGLDRHSDNPICTEYRNLDLTQHRLLYDGPLVLKLGDAKRVKNIDLHVLLLEKCIMLLQKQDEKYLLKFHSSASGLVPGKDDSRKLYHSPIIKFSTMLVRPVATDKRAFYLLNTTPDGPQIYELVADSAPECSLWYKQITESVNAFKSSQITRRSYSDATDAIVSEDKTDSDRTTTRSQSFHEPSGSHLPDPMERQVSSPPDGLPMSGSDTPTSGSRKRLQRVEILKIAEVVPLIDPSQVLVTQDRVLVADPVTTPIEKLRIKDEEVAKALEEKQRLIEDIFHIPQDEFETIADITGTPGHSNKDAREVLIAALAQAKKLTNFVNQTLKVCEDEAITALSVCQREERSAPRKLQREPPPEQSDQLTQITSSMNRHLTTLLEIVQERDDERERLRQDLIRSQEQVRTLIAGGSVEASYHPLQHYASQSMDDPQQETSITHATPRTPSLASPVSHASIITSTSTSPACQSPPPSTSSPTPSSTTSPPPLSLLSPGCVSPISSPHNLSTEAGAQCQDQSSFFEDGVFF